VIGFIPIRIDIYEQALIHKSISNKTSENNERLEYIGDAILNTVVAEYLFKKYPQKNEGFLTQMRSKMVNRKRMHLIAMQLNIDLLMQHDSPRLLLRDTQSALGDALEALIGAVFLDKGYNKARHFILYKIIKPLMNMQEIEHEDISPKNKILSWASKNKKELVFEIVEEINNKRLTSFTIVCKIDNNIKGKGKSNTKKEAEQIAAAEALTLIDAYS